jgi:hypothetical protein
MTYAHNENPFRVTGIVTFRPAPTQASPCSSVWQYGHATLAAAAQRAADGPGSCLIADRRLEPVDAPRGALDRNEALL